MFSPDGTLISASAAPHCGDAYRRKRKKSKGEEVQFQIINLERYERLKSVSTVKRRRLELSRIGVVAADDTLLLLLLYGPDIILCGELGSKHQLTN